MIYKIYDSLLLYAERTNKYKLFFWLCNHFPRLNAEYDRRMQEAMKAVDLKEQTEEEKKESWEKLCEKIREKYGEDAI